MRRRMDVAKLKEPSEAPEILNRMMRLACVRYELISQVRAANLNSESAKIKPGSSSPRGSNHKALSELRRRYAEADCNWDRLKIIGEAQTLSEAARGRPNPARRRGTSAWKRAIANDTRASAIVGEDFGVSASYVRKLRTQLRRI